MRKHLLTVSAVVLGASCGLLLAAGGPAAPAAAAPDGISIGWASQDVTPAQPVLLYGQLTTRVSKAVKDPVTVTALAIEAPGPDKAADQAIMISCDLEYVPALIQQRVREGFHGQVPDFDVRKLFLNATHTHTAPVCLEGQYWLLPGVEAMAPAAYAEFFVGRAVEAAVTAWKNRKPAAVGWALTKAVIGHIRIGAIAGYEDHDVNLLYVWDEKEQLTGVVVNLACPAQISEGESFVSADFWHEIRLALRAKYGKSLFVLPQCAAAGDMQPPGPTDWGLRQRQAVAESVAAAVAEGLEPARREMRRQAPFCHVVEELALPVRMVTEEELRVAKMYTLHHDMQFKTVSTSTDKNQQYASLVTRSLNYVLRNRYADIVTRYERQKTNPTFRMELHVVRLGDVVFATNSFELFLDYGLRIKARSKAKQTFLLQLASNVDGFPAAAAQTPPGDAQKEPPPRAIGIDESYLATERVIKVATPKSYSANAEDNQVSPEGGQALVERTVKVIESIWTQK